MGHKQQLPFMQGATHRPPGRPPAGQTEAAFAAALWAICLLGWPRECLQWAWITGQAGTNQLCWLAAKSALQCRLPFLGTVFLAVVRAVLVDTVFGVPEGSSTNPRPATSEDSPSRRDSHPKRRAVRVGCLEAYLRLARTDQLLQIEDTVSGPHSSPAQHTRRAMRRPSLFCLAGEQQCVAAPQPLPGPADGMTGREQSIAQARSNSVRSRAPDKAWLTG